MICVAPSSGAIQVRVAMAGADSYADAIASVQQRRCWTVFEKFCLVQQTYEPGASVGRIARSNRIDHHLLRRWRRLAKRDALGDLDHRCALCGEHVEASRLDAVFCSSKCRQKSYRLRELARIACT